jgi:glycosyltransferase involved in cell wall biosynthesis
MGGINARDEGNNMNMPDRNLENVTGQEIASDLTAIVPTFERPFLLVDCISSLINANPRPNRILVSEGSTNVSARRKTLEVVMSFGEAVELVPEPPNGKMCGNRNHLVKCVDTEFVLMIDDDLLVHEKFIDVGLQLLRTRQVEIVTVGEEQGWFTFRGFWRVGEPGEACGISLGCVMGETQIFSNHPLDEAIIYGSEDLDFALSIGNRRVVMVNLVPTDPNAGNTVRYETRERDVLANSSRVLVGIRRYWRSRLRLALFVSAELGASLLGRTPFPRQCHQGQWIATAKRIAGVPVTRP